MADDDLARNAETGHDVAELTVAVGGLVEVHEVHVDGLPRNLLVVLGGQLQQRLGKHFEATDPHLGRGEGVAPSDHTDDVRVGRGFGHEGLDAVGGLQGGLEHDLGRDLAGVVQEVDYFAGLLSHLAQRFLAVQVLRTDAEPDFLTFEWVFHCHGMFLYFVVGFRLCSRLSRWRSVTSARSAAATSASARRTKGRRTEVRRP